MAAIKFFEVRANMTKIFVGAVKLQFDYSLDVRVQCLEEDLLKEAGFDPTCGPIYMFRLDEQNKGTWDPFSWDLQELRVAHKFIEQNFYSLRDGWVIDAETLLGTKDTMKIPDIYVEEKQEELHFFATEGAIAHLQDEDILFEIRDNHVVIRKEDVEKMGKRIYRFFELGAVPYLIWKV